MAWSTEQRAAFWTPEQRAIHSAKMKARKQGPMGAETETAETSNQPSPLSSDSPSSSSPPVLPASKKRKPKKSFLESLTGTEAETEPTLKTSSFRSLPTNPDELERELVLARLPAQIPVVMADELAKALGLSPLSEAEKRQGVEAFACLFWQMGLYNDGRVLVPLWLAGITIPRFIEWTRERTNRAKRIEREAFNGPVAVQRAADAVAATS